MTESVKVGRNEPCPCGSGKKYKRCCGVNAAPKLSVPLGSQDLPPVDPNILNGMDPQYMMQVSQAIQRLPKGQLQRLQSIMQKAMSGRDVASEAKEFEKSLPLEFQNLIKSFQMPNLPENAEDMAGVEGAMEALVSQSTSTSEMTEEKARALVAQAAAEGTISSEQAKSLLQGADTTLQQMISKSESPRAPETPSGVESESESEKQSKFGKFWRNLSGKKNNI